MNKQTHTAVIGAGIGGLTAAALLLRAGHRVTVLEAHVYPGGSAGTFYHKGYLFDAGATLAGGFSPGGPHARVGDLLGLNWPIRPADPAWVVHLPDGRMVTQWADAERWRQERQTHFPETEPFWRIQELLADISWDIAARPFPWPPQTPGDLIVLAQAIRPSTLRALPYLTRTIGAVAPDAGPMFRAFLDGQLLISAQTMADRANALYASAALDLPRRGVNHVRGGIGSLAKTLVSWIRAHGGEVHYRQEVQAIVPSAGDGFRLKMKKGKTVQADVVLANVTPWALHDLLGDNAPGALRREVSRRRPTWGAFTLYLGLDRAALPEMAAGHHQVIVDQERPLGEGNSVFISLADFRDTGRAPEGKIAATLSTHTAVEPWWALANQDQEGYLERRAQYQTRLLDAAEKALPGIGTAVELSLPGTPVTFDYYTRRPMGMVGGFAQTSLFDARGPQTGVPNLWLVGDSIFPGQSTAGVTLGAMRVAAQVLRAFPVPSAAYRQLSITN